MMKVSRRKFVAAVPVVAGSLMVGGQALGQIARRMGTGDALSAFSWDSFIQYVNTEFAFGTGRDAVQIKLIDITDSRPVSRRSKRRGQENFVLKFSGPAGMPLTQNTYHVEHFGLGTFDLFITEGAREGNEKFYFAVINRSRS
jgi:hypothetical protein